MPISPDLSKAKCYYSYRISVWAGLIFAFAVITIGTLALLGFDIGQYNYERSLWYTGPIRPEVAEGLGALGLLSLFLLIPRLRYSGPSLAIADEGVYVLLWGAHLELVGWDNILEFKTFGNTGPRVIISFGNPSYGNYRRAYGVEMYLKDLDLMFEVIGERYGKLPFLMNMQYTLRRDETPFRIRTDTLRGANRDEILKQLELGLVQHREKAKIKSD